MTNAERDKDMIVSIEMWLHECEPKYVEKELAWLDELRTRLLEEKSEKPIIPNDRDEAAKEYAKTAFKKPYSDNPDEEVTIVEPDKYAGFIAGAKWDREQMMKEAVEGEVINDNRGNNVVRAGAFNKNFEYGDKVRVIVLPKED